MYGCLPKINDRELALPRTLEELDYPTIRRLVIDGYYETDTFEFKPSLKPEFGDQKKRHEYNERILNSASAFANTYGGFIIFGIEDLKNKSGEERIVGVDRTDLAAEFSNKIKSIDPTIYYNLKNPPIPIPNKSRVLLAVHIPISSSRPHMVSSTGRFYYRTNGGNRIMNYNEVKKEFLTFEERRYKLNLFYIEIIGNLKIAEQMVRLANREINTATGFLSYSTLKFETTLMSSLLPDIFGIISNDQQLINSLLLLKLQMSPINTAIDVFHSYAPNIEQMKNQLGTHNDYINLNVRNRTLPLLRTIKEGLELRYNLTSPISDTDFLDF